MADVTVVVRYFAAARAAAGMDEEKLELPAGATVGTALDEARVRHGAELDRVLARCSFLLDEVAVHGQDTPLTDATTLDVLPPFAGG